MAAMAVTLALGGSARAQTGDVPVATQVPTSERFPMQVDRDCSDSYNVVTNGQAYGVMEAPLPVEPPASNTFISCAEINTIGGSYYDLQTNYSIGNRLVSAGDHFLAAWTGSIEESPYPDRGSFVLSGSTDTWYGNPYGRVEEVRTGFPAIVSCPAMEQILVSHILDTVPGDELYLARQAGPNQGWLHGSVPSELVNNKLWPRAAAGGADGNTVHVVAHLDGNVAGQDYPLVYARSTDAGQTWDIIDHLFAELDSTVKKTFTAETYALHARGNTVALAVFGFVEDSYVLVSQDNGITWERMRFFDFPIDGYEPDDGLPESPSMADDFDGDGIAQEYLSTDGSGAVHIDENGVVHVAFGSMYYMDNDTLDGGYSVFYTTNGVRYWNSNMPENNSHLIAYAPDLNSNGTLDLGILPLDNYYVGLASMPTFASDSEGGLFLSYSGVAEGYIAWNAMNCRHQFLIHSLDGGSTWNSASPTDLTPDGGPQVTEWGSQNYEYSYGCLNPAVENGAMQLLVQRDAYAGTAVLGSHATSFNRTWYIDIPLEAIVGDDVCLEGCMDDAACNYDLLANTEGPCTYPEPGLTCWGGCVDANACNFIEEGLNVYENFDGYNEGTWVSSLPNWVPWEADSLETEPDAQLVTAPLDANGNGNGLALRLHTPEQSVGSGVVYVTDVEGGNYGVSFQMHVPSESLARYNFQEFAEPGLGWAFVGVFNPDGTFHYFVDDEEVAAGTYDQDVWLSVWHDVDMIEDVITIYLGGYEVASFPFDSALGGVNFYSSNSASGNAFYVDDLSVNLFSSGECDYCGAQMCEDQSATNYGSLGACCYANATYPAFPLLKSWKYSDTPDAIMVGTAPQMGEYYSGSAAPEQENDRFTFFANGAFHYETQGDVLNAYDFYNSEELEFDMAGFAFLEGTGWNGADQVVLLNGAFGFGCPFIGVMDSGPYYDILELTEETLVLSAPVNDVNCQATQEFFTLRFEADGDLSPDAEGMCEWGCTDATSLVYDPDAIYDNGLCIIDPNAYTCNDIGTEVWEAIPLGMSPDYQSGTLGVEQTWSWVFNVPASLVEPASGVSYGMHHVEWLSFSGTPEWAELGPVPGLDLAPSTQHCIELLGTPSSTGSYVLTVTFEAFISIFGQPFSTGVQDFEVTLEILDNPNPIPGCTYVTAQNYVSYANLDDGSCEFAGCTDPEAVNYNPLATTDDGSCSEACDPTGESGCLADNDGDGIVAVSDLLILLGEFGSSCD